MRKPFQSPGRMKKSSYYMYIATVGVRTHDLPHAVASNMVKMSHAINHSATTAVVHSTAELPRSINWRNYVHVHMKSIADITIE